MKITGIVVALSALLTASNACAQASYPDKPLRILVGFVAGGPADIIARTVGDKLTEAWGRPVVIENVTGSGGNMATDRVAKAAPDGYTLLLGTSGPFAIHPSLYPKLPFDPVKDFAPITQLCLTANVLVVNNDVPAKNVAELTALARAQPGKLTFASAGVGTTQHLSGELYKTMAGIDLQHVPYRGIAAVMPDLLGGRVTMVFSSPSSALPLVREGMHAWPAVLVVDDFRTMTNIITRLLQEIGVTDVDSVNDGPSALQCLRRKRYGLILSDWEMQPMDGPQLIKAIRADPAISDIPVILATAKHDRDASWLSGGDGYIVKPFGVSALRDKVQNVLSRHAAETAAMR